MGSILFEISPEDVYTSIPKDIRVPEPPPAYVPPINCAEPLPKLETEPGPVVSYTRLVELAAENRDVQLEVQDEFTVVVAHIRGANTVCVMCLQPLMRICSQCQDGEQVASTCTIQKGVCGHFIHGHCLAKFNHSGLCLTCRQHWKVAHTYKLADAITEATH